MKLKVLVGAGDRIMALTAPFAAAGIVANVLWPGLFAMGTGILGLAAGILLLAAGMPVWLFCASRILACVPQGRLITTGPFAVVCHPMYTAVALLVLPGLGLVLDTWLGLAMGAILYLFARLFSRSEDAMLAKIFPEEYPRYRARVLFPWL